MNGVGCTGVGGGEEKDTAHRRLYQRKKANKLATNWHILPDGRLLNSIKRRFQLEIIILIKWGQRFGKW